jgi:hypothetical protein
MVLHAGERTLQLPALLVLSRQAQGVVAYAMQPLSRRICMDIVI